MKNWSIDEEKLKQYPEKYAIWKLEQLINYGFDGEKINTSVLKKYWNKLSIDPENRKFLSFLLWPPRDSSFSQKNK
ncbi:MAG: hypothetical protein HYT46_02315 [Candidatus Vogelbacteria bacterium]|nr:hypothetical protein [Candidatus Vogelbacteria bacterium]